MENQANLPQFPNNILTHKMLNSDAKNYLFERGIGEKTALDLGYFTVSKVEAQKLLNQDISGLAITYYDIDRKPVGYRLRPFQRDWNIYGKKRDKTLKAKGELPKFLSKPKPAKKYDEETETLIVAEPEAQRINKAYFCPVLDWREIQQKTSIDIVITEGEVKATSACLNDIPTIALAGVDGWKNKIAMPDDSVNDEFLLDLEWLTVDDKWKKTYWQNRSVALIFDSDIVSKWQVQRALKALAKELRIRGANPFLVLLPNEMDGDKNGIDDFIVRHGADAFKKLIQQFKILDKSPAHKLMEVNPETLTYEFRNLEPINSIKGLMAWSVLKDQVAYREGYGWYEWNGKYWKMIPESKVLGLIQEFRYSNQWLNNNDKAVFDDFKNALSKQEIEWNNSQILGFENGYLDTNTNELIPHDKSLYLTAILPFNYNQSSGCPQWVNFLHSVFDTQDEIEYLRAWFKWILAPKPENFPIEATLWLVGKQGTGKGTLLSVLRALVGKENYGGFEPDLITNPNHLFGLVDKKLALNSDATGFIANVGIYNRICSNEPVTVKNLYHNQFDTPLNTVTVLAMNKPIGFPSGGSEGLSRRLHVLKLDKIPSRRDPDLKEKLLGELEGIFAWCWGLSMTQVKQILNWRVEGAVSEIYENQITEILFLKEAYPDGNSCVQASELYSEYAEWCKNNGYKSANSQNFYLSLKKIKGIEKTSTKNGKFYSIPTMEKYTDPEFNNTTFKPTEAISNLDETVTGSCKGDVAVTGFGDGFNPDTARAVTGVTGFSEKNCEGGKKINDPTEKVLEIPVTNGETNTQQDLDPSPSEKDPRHTRHHETQQGIEQKAQNNQDELSKYKGFQSVGKLNSSDIREARNRSEKIKADILACTNTEELKLVREEFGYLPQEIEWVWINLLTKREKAQITQMTEQNQLDLLLQNQEIIGDEIDFMDMMRKIKEVLISLDHETDPQRKQAMREITGLDKKLKDYTDEEWLMAYEKVMKMKK